MCSESNGMIVRIAFITIFCFLFPRAEEIVDLDPYVNIGDLSLIAANCHALLRRGT